MVPSPLFLSPSDDLHGPPFQRSSASAIENMNSYEENEKGKDGAKIQFCAVFALCAKTAQDFLRKLRLAPSVKRKDLRCAATKTTLFKVGLRFGSFIGVSRSSYLQSYLKSYLLEWHK